MIAKETTVAELVEFLKNQPQDMLVAYQRYSECALLSLDDISTIELCHHRPDGWIQARRDDKLLRKYLVFPGN